MQTRRPFCRHVAPFTSRRASSSRPAAGSTRRGRHHTTHVVALGFDFGDSAPASAPPRAPSPKAFGVFGLKASSLLVYGAVFKGAVGEALLALLSQSQKYQASNKDIIAAYAKFYNLLMLAGYDCWRDYVLDQILLGRDNPFARAVAQGQVERGAPILQAVAYDLDTLQGLAVPLTVLSEYVGEVAPTAGSYWVSAASALAVRRPSSASSAKALAGDGAPIRPAVVIPADAAPSISTTLRSGSSPGNSGNSGSSGGAPLGGPQAAMAAGGGGGGSSGFIGPPPSAEQLAEWKAAFAGHDPWSDGLGLLQQYYAQHGFGITSRNATLRWSKGGFEEASEGGLALAAGNNSSSGSSSNPATTLAPPMAAAAAAAAQTPPCVLSLLSGPQAALAANTARHCAGLPAQHAVVAGPPGCGKSWLLWEGSLMAGRAAGLRLVDVPASEVPNLLDIARGCGRYPRARFILVADQLELPLRGGAGAADLLAGLGGAGGSGWPSNTLLYVGASAASAVSRSDPLVARCPLVVPVSPLADEEQFLQVVRELAPGCGAGGDAQQLRDAASAWVAAQGLSVRSAAEFVRSCLE